MSIEQLLCEVIKKQEDILDHFNNLSSKWENSISTIDKNDEILTIEDVTKITKYKKNTIYCMVSKGEIPHFKASPKALRFNKTEILRWMENKYRS